MAISRNHMSLGMIGLCLFVSLIAVALDDYSENMNIDVLAFTENVLALFSVLFLVGGIFLAIFNQTRRKTQTRGHHFETPPRRIHRGG